MPADKLEGHHWSDADIDRRFLAYNNFNHKAEHEQKSIVIDFFHHHHIPTFEQAFNEDQTKILGHLKQFINENISTPTLDMGVQKESDQEILARHLEKESEPKEEAKVDAQQEVASKCLIASYNLF